MTWTDPITLPSHLPFGGKGDKVTGQHIFQPFEIKHLLSLIYSNGLEAQYLPHKGGGGGGELKCANFTKVKV